LSERLDLEAHTTLGISNFVYAAGSAGLTMASPPKAYPHDWRAGAVAYETNFGAELVGGVAGGFTHFAVAAIDHEDPRYYAAQSGGFFGRTMHAVVFTAVDRNNAGHRTLALSNFAGSAGGGAIGMLFYPDGFRDVTHAYQRASWDGLLFVARNVLTEFSPEITETLHKMHISDGLSKTFLPYQVRKK
jgi:hypothetical protein